MLALDRIRARSIDELHLSKHLDGSLAAHDATGDRRARDLGPPAQHVDPARRGRDALLEDLGAEKRVQKAALARVELTDDDEQEGHLEPLDRVGQGVALARSHTVTFEHGECIVRSGPYLFEEGPLGVVENSHGSILPPPSRRS